MGEIKQTNFRIDQEAADAFRKFCESNGMNQAQGFDHVMQVVEMDHAKAATPERATEIEEFERYVKGIMAAYLTSVEINSNAEARIREQFASSLDRKDKTISTLQEKVEQLQSDKVTAEQTATSAAAAAAQAIKESAAAKEQAETASKLADEKDKTISTLADKLSVAEEKVAGYDELKKSEETAKMKIVELQKDADAKKAEAERAMKAIQDESERTLKAAQEANNRELEGLKKDHETEIRELKADMERKISDARKDAALSCANEVAKKEREMNALIREADKANARLQVQLENLQDRIAELTAVLEKAQGKGDS
jgi:hypothetical protein